MWRHRATCSHCGLKSRWNRDRELSEAEILAHLKDSHNRDQAAAARRLPGGAGAPVRLLPGAVCGRLHQVRPGFLQPAHRGYRRPVRRVHLKPGPPYIRLLINVFPILRDIFRPGFASRRPRRRPGLQILAQIGLQVEDGRRRQGALRREPTQGRRSDGYLLVNSGGRAAGNLGAGRMPVGVFPVQSR